MFFSVLLTEPLSLLQINNFFILLQGQYELVLYLFNYFSFITLCTNLYIYSATKYDTYFRWFIFMFIVGLHDFIQFT